MSTSSLGACQFEKAMALTTLVRAVQVDSLLNGLECEWENNASTDILVKLILVRRNLMDLGSLDARIGIRSLFR